MDVKKLKTDTDAEVSGVWVPIDDETELLIARLGNPRYRDAMARKGRPYRTAARNNTLPEDILTKILIEAIAETVLLGWKNFKEDGVELEYSPATAKRLLEDYPDFRDLVVGLAGDAELYRQEY